MLKHELIHPVINAVIGRAGHHGRILIADGNFPTSSKKGSNASLVSMNLSPGIITCAQALRAVLSAVPVEAVSLMDYEREGPYALTEDPPVWADYRKVMKDKSVAIEPTLLEKWAFYDAVMTPDHILTIQTADQQRYANILLDIGVRMDD